MIACTVVTKSKSEINH